MAKNLVELPATYGRGKMFVAGSAKAVQESDGTFVVTVTLADGTEHTVYDKLENVKRTQIRVDDLNTIEE